MEYEVKKGDGWYRIAKNLGVNVNDLLQANNAKLDTMLQPGQKLKTSKVTEQPSMTNQWQVVAGQNDAAANWAKQRVDTTMNDINQTLAEKEAITSLVVPGEQIISIASLKSSTQKNSSVFFTKGVILPSS